MAYKRSNGKLRRRKIEPAVHSLYFTTSVAQPGAAAVDYIDLSQVASIVNRRFYRQGINWVVGGFKVTSSVSGAVILNKLPTTWTMHNAWKKGMMHWRKMVDEAVEDQESLKGRFMDFKIYADEDHHAAGFNGNLLPKTLNGNGTTTALAGEWIPSKYIIPRGDGTEQSNTREIVATGANYPGVSASTGLNAVSLIEGYAASRALPYQTDPNTPDDANNAAGGTPLNWLAALDNDGLNQDAAVITDATSENDIAPYPFEGDGINVDTMYPGGQNQLPGMQLHDFSSITATTVGGITYLKGGEFPCGLIRIDFGNTSESAANLGIQIDLVPGNHRGYMCEPMGA